MEKPHTRMPDTYMLNARFLLILLVVIANMLEPLIQQSRAVNTIYLWIYSFHIPMFAFVTGHFAKNFRLDGQGIKSLNMIFFQYFVFQSLYSTLDILVFHAPGIKHSFFIPYSLLWFLLSHLCWRLLLRLFVSFRHPMLIAAGMGILIGYLPLSGTVLSFSRTFVFFPFFLAGYYFRYEKGFQAFTAAYRWLGVILAAGIAVALYWAPMDPRWLYSSFTYAELGTFGWMAGVYRIGIYLLEIAAALCFLSLVPHMQSILTHWGQYTVYVFLLHGFIVKTAIAAGLFAYIHSPQQLVVVFIAAAAVTWLLLRAQVRSWSRPLIEPNLDAMSRFLLRKRAA